MNNEQSVVSVDEASRVPRYFLLLRAR